MNRISVAALAAVVALCTSALAHAASSTPSASPSPDPATDVQVGASHEMLDHKYPSWDTQYLRITKKTPNETLYAELDTTSRFNKVDDQEIFGLYFPVALRWTGMAEVSASSSHTILPSSGLTVGAQYDSGGHWYEGLAARHLDYTAGSINGAVLSIEHYWRGYRLNYTLTALNLIGSGTDVEHSLEVDSYYGRLNSYIGVGYVTGREIDNIGLPVLVTSHVDGWNLTGRHWVNDHWGFDYGVGTFTQGTLYTRAGGHVGLDYRL